MNVTKNTPLSMPMPKPRVIRAQNAEVEAAIEKIQERAEQSACGACSMFLRGVAAELRKALK